MSPHRIFSRKVWITEWRYTMYKPKNLNGKAQMVVMTYLSCIGGAQEGQLEILQLWL